jgi:hypothetical protein
MKRLLIAIAVLSFTIPTQAQTKGVVTETIPVKGNCEMCQKRIENAAYSKGVKLAKWDKTSQTLTVTYNSSKTDATTIAQGVANAGHDAGAVKATEKEYNKLPDCCAYKTNTHQH